jgi:hypothetical protein
MRVQSMSFSPPACYNAFTKAAHVEETQLNTVCGRQEPTI